MNLLLSLVNSEMSLVGFNWDTGKLFWSVPATELRACGLCYHNQDLLIASDDTVLRVTPTGRQTIPLSGQHPSLAHSVHRVNEHEFGVADTGNSCVRILSEAGDEVGRYAPFDTWGPLPLDAVHLNDFTVTPWGIIASCFESRPWRAVQWQMQEPNRWMTAGLGVLLNVSDADDCGRVVACGLNHPHSLVCDGDHLFHCSSSTGVFHQWGVNSSGELVEVDRIRITQRHFLRGALRVNNRWVLGGSSSRHHQRLCERAGVYCFNESSRSIQLKELPMAGEIYEIVPWQDWVIDSIHIANSQ